MANTLLTPSIITKENLRVLHQKLNFIGRVDRTYEDRFAISGAKIGATINVRKPARYTVTTGAALSTQDSTDTQMPLTISTQAHVDISFSSQELTLSVDNFSQRYLEPAMAQLAAYMENDALGGLYNTVYQASGSPASPANSLRPFLTARKYMNNSLTPMDGARSIIMNTDTNVDMVDALKGLFQSSDEIAEQYTEGLLGRTAGFTFLENTLIPTHTVGALGGSGKAVTGTLTGSSITTGGWSNGVNGLLKKGDIITFANVYGVHPESRQSFGYLQQFVVTADVNSDGSGNATVNISPAITTSGPFQTVNAAPINNAAITVVGTASQTYGVNLAFHKNAFAFATVDLEDVSQYGAWGARENYDGVSLRVARQYAIGTDTLPCRIDVLYGYAPLYPQLACRVHNQIASS